MKKMYSMLFIGIVWLSSLSAVTTVEIAMHPRCYASFDGSFTKGILHIQYGLTSRAGLRIDLLDPIDLTVTGGFSFLDSSRPYGNSVERGLTSWSLNIGFDLSFSPVSGITTLLETHYATYLDTSVRMVHLEIAVIPYLLLTETDLLKIFLEVPVTYDIRRDIGHNISAGIGLRMGIPFRSPS